MAVKNLRDVIVKAVEDNKRELRQLQMQNYVVHMFFYQTLIEDHIVDLLQQAVMSVTRNSGLTKPEQTAIKSAAFKYTKGQLTIANIAYLHEKFGYKTFRKTRQQAEAFDKATNYSTPGRSGTPKMPKGRIGPKIVFVHDRTSKQFGVEMATVMNAKVVVATYKGSMGSDEANRGVMGLLIQRILDHATGKLEKQLPYLKSGKGGKLKNKTKAGNPIPAPGENYEKPGPFSARGNFARLHGPIATRFGSSTPNPTVNDGYGDTSVPVVGLVETLREQRIKALDAGDFVTGSATMYLASKLDASFNVNSTTISDLLKFEKVIEFGMALGSNVPGSTAGSQQSMMSPSDTEEVLNILEKIVEDALANKNFSDDFKTSKGITQRLSEIGGSAYLKEILSKKWWNKPNMRLKVNKELVKLGKTEKEMSQALHSIIIAGAAKIQGQRSPKKGKRSNGKVNTRKRVATSTAKQRQNPMALKNLINSVLPQMVAMKMNPPALRYRTGRFANSARVTQVTQGPRGGLQADYTYMRNPYETFEPGGKQGSTMRDPRKIIGETIRDIVAHSMQNRFIKTRRI